MDDMEIDQIVDVPDTPDRSTTRHSGQKYVGDADVYVNERRERVFPAAENGKNGRLAFSPLKSSTNGEVSSLKKSCPPQNDPIFRRSRTGKFLGHELTHSSGSGKMEKGKDICTKVPSKLSSRGREGVAVFDLTEDNGEPRKIKTVSRLRMKDSATENKKELKVTMGNSPIPCIPDSSNTSTNAFAEKCKIDCKALPCTNVSVDRGKSIDLSNDSQERAEKQKSLPHHLLNTSRFRGSKRLVRNGCISPHNIAARAKQSSEQNTQRTNHFEFSHAKDALSPTCNNDIIAEEKSGSRVKGKELYIHPSSAHVTGSIHGANSNPFVNNEEADGMGSVIRNSLGSSCGWRTTRNHRSIDQPLHDLTGHLSRRGSESESFISSQYGNREDRRNTGRSQSSMDGRYPLRNDAPHATSMIIPDAEQFTRPCPTADKLTKRQRKDGSTSRNPNSEIMILDLLGESSNSSSSRSPVLDSEDIELLPDSDNVNNNDSDARARQVEADEILARELQEQLYHEDSVNGTEQIDEHLAWELQHEEDLGHTSIESHHTSHPRWLSREPSNRSIRTRSHQSPTNRRRAVPHVPLSNRVSQLRSRIANRSSMPAISTRGGRLRFPMDMDFDMRLDILEALEDAFGDFNDMGVADDILQAHRDFNENDYEMLLALDENNHQHAGASATQINNLPQSTIQTDNFQEACAICLEIPVMGDTIRHLPCLHKFHKDCIDPWLHRRTSCPVCKSSIT